MLTTKIKKLISLAFVVSLLLVSCGGGEDTQAIIQTSVAETVAAQASTAEPATETPSATLVSTQTPFALPTLPTPFPSPTTAANAGGKAQCASASLSDETVVDGKIFKPGEQFIKTWYITNTSACVWDTTYKIVFWSGDILGGGYVYNLPRVTGPGQTVPIELVLTTPETPGTYRSEWKLQTPDGIPFGVGVYQAAFYTEIQVVSSSVTPTYDIVSATLQITREPVSGCQPANITFRANIVIVTNGPLKFKYRIYQQDGNNDYVKTVTMKEASEFTDSEHVWKLGRAASQNSNRWMKLVIVDPFYREYPPVGFTFECP